jgi:protein-tyrosine-phosphatase
LSPRVVDRAIEDPKRKHIQRVRAIMDEIEKRIKEMLKEIEDT